MFGTRPKSNVDPEVQELTNRMRSKYFINSVGTGVSSLIKAENAPTHHMDCNLFIKQFSIGAIPKRLCILRSRSKIKIN